MKTLTLKVRVLGRGSIKAGREYISLYVVIPSTIANLLKIEKGDILECTIQDINVNGRKVKAVIYFKSQS